MSALVLLLTVLLTVAAAWGKPVVTLSVLVATTLLLPGTLLVPHSPTGILTCSRVVEAGAAVGVLLACRRDPRPTARPPMALLLLLAFLAVSAVTGVGMADPLTDHVTAAYGWVSQAEQAVVLVLALELGRRLSATTALVVLAAGATAAAGIGLAEGVTHSSYAHALFRAVPEQLASNPAGPLERRAGGFRVRGAADFALAYGWVLTALLPAVALLLPALRERFPGPRAALPLLVVPAVVATVYVTHSRSPLVGTLVVLAVLLVVLAPRDPLGRLGVLVVAVVGAAVAAPALQGQLSSSVDAGSIDVRVQRLPDVLDLAAQRPLQGAGITSIGRLGLGGVDSSYVLTYVETGAIAVVLLVAALLAGLLTVGRAVPGGADEDRPLVLASLIGMVALVAGAVTFDVFTVLPAERLFWLLCGLGAAAAARRRGPEPLPPARRVFSVLSVLVVGLAVCVGLLARALWPEHHSSEVVFATLSQPVEVRDDPRGLGRTLVTTVCQAAREVAQPGQRWSVATCSETSPPGWGRLRLTAPFPFVTEQGVLRVYSTARAVPGLDALRMSETATSPEAGIPTVARVAPEALGLTTALLLLLPVRRRRRVAERDG